jgi:hypothetical protein
MKAQTGANKITREIDDKIDLRNCLSPLRHFTEHLVGVSEKLPWESNLDHKFTSFLNRQLMLLTCNHPQATPTKITTTIHHTCVSLWQTEDGVEALFRR